MRSRELDILTSCAGPLEVATALKDSEHGGAHLTQNSDLNRLRQYWMSKISFQRKTARDFLLNTQARDAVASGTSQTRNGRFSNLARAWTASLLESLIGLVEFSRSKVAVPELGIVLTFGALAVIILTRAPRVIYMYSACLYSTPKSDSAVIPYRMNGDTSLYQERSSTSMPGAFREARRKKHIAQGYSLSLWE